MLSLPIDGYGLLLREFRDADIPAIARIAATDGFNFYALAPSNSSKAEIEESAASFVHKAMALKQIDPVTGIRENYKLAVAEIAAPEKLIGYVALDEWSEGRGEMRDIGYLIDPRMQGRGHATFACALLLGRFFDSTAYDMVYATVHPENTPSRKVLEKLGYAEIGATTKVVKGSEEPRIILSLHRQDFLAAVAPIRNNVMEQRLVGNPYREGTFDCV